MSLTFRELYMLKCVGVGLDNAIDRAQAAADAACAEWGHVPVADVGYSTLRWRRSVGMECEGDGARCDRCGKQLAKSECELDALSINREVCDIWRKWSDGGISDEKAKGRILKALNRPTMKADGIKGPRYGEGLSCK